MTDSQLPKTLIELNCRDGNIKVYKDIFPNQSFIYAGTNIQWKTGEIPKIFINYRKCEVEAVIDLLQDGQIKGNRFSAQVESLWKQLFPEFNDTITNVILSMNLDKYPIKVCENCNNIGVGYKLIPHTSRWDNYYSITYNPVTKICSNCGCPYSINIRESGCILKKDHRSRHVINKILKIV